MTIDNEQNFKGVSGTECQVVRKCQDFDQLMEGQRYLLRFMGKSGGERFSHKTIYRGRLPEGFLKFDIIPPGARRAGSKRYKTNVPSLSLSERMFGCESGGIVAYLVQEPRRTRMQNLLRSNS